jgi:hypothetical protein
MKKSVYQENVENSIKRNIRLSGFTTPEEVSDFLQRIEEFCIKFDMKQIKKHKTRHGSGKS